MKTLTIFTPTYNRAHTLRRTYESLCRQTCRDFEWLVVDDGSTDSTRDLVRQFMAEERIDIHYIQKENGGLHTGYNVAYAHIRTELCACVDSDDLMPPDAVALIVEDWRRRGGPQYAGLVGLDNYLKNNRPIGGKFPEGLDECFLMDLQTHRLHRGDVKMVMRTDLMRQVAPQVGFPGEKHFNPVYMLLQVCDRLPLLVLNEALCLVEYQETDSMSAAIFRQYADSPRSFAQLRRLEMTLKHNTWLGRARSAAHYVSSSIIARNSAWLKESPRKALTLLMVLPGVAFWLYIRYKNRC